MLLIHQYVELTACSDCFTCLGLQDDIVLLPVPDMPAAQATAPVQRWKTDILAELAEIPPLHQFVTSHRYDVTRIPALAQFHDAVSVCPPSLLEGGSLHSQMLAVLRRIAEGTFAETLRLRFLLPLSITPKAPVIIQITITGRPIRTVLAPAA